MLKYLDLGSGETVIVFVHGLGSWSQAWEPQFELADTYRLIIPDLRGHGESYETYKDEEITIHNLASDVIELLDHLGIESAYIAGLSLGGIVAQELFKQRPNIVKGLILSNTTYLVPSIFANPMIKEAEKALPTYKDELIQFVSFRGLFDKTNLQNAKKSFLITDQYIDAAKATLDVNYMSTLIGTYKPVLLIGGTHDSVCPVFNVYAMKWMMPLSQIKIFEAGHLSNIECPEEFNQTIREFIGG